MKLALTEEELGDMRTFMEKVADGKMEARHTVPVVAAFEQRFEETFKRLEEGGRTPALWVQYHNMVDVIKVFIRTERLADHNGHLSCIIPKMLDIFAAAGHHQYAKGALLYFQLMKELETLPAYQDTLENFTAHGNRVVRYSSHEWSGTCCNTCIEQTLMKAAKSEGGLSRGRMRNSVSGHKCWVLTLSHFSDVNQQMEEDVRKHAPLHRDLAKTHMKRDAEAVELAGKWFEENKPFDNARDKELLISFSTGLCEGDVDVYMDIFLDTEATKEAVIQAGTVIFQYIYHGPDATFGEIRYNMFSRKAMAEVIKPETLPPTDGAAAQNSLRPYLQTRDWIGLHSMSLNPSNYGWILGVHGYEPVPKLDPWLLRKYLN